MFVASVADSQVKADSSDGHEPKHNACRAEIAACVSDYTYINRVNSPQNVHRGCLDDCNQAQADAHPKLQAQDRRKGLSPERCSFCWRLAAGGLYLLKAVVCGRNAARNIASTEGLHCISLRREWQVATHTYTCIAVHSLQSTVMSPAPSPASNPIEQQGSTSDIKKHVHM